MGTLRINKWSETFENADSRKRQRLGFFYAPSGCDSAGYLALMSEFEPAEGWQTIGIFMALCQQAATMRREVRGSFINSSGKPMTVAQVAMLIRCEKSLLERAIEILTDERVKWLSADDVPPICQSSASVIPSLWEGQGQGQGQEQGQGQGQGQAQEATPSPSANQLPLDELKNRINALRPEWQKPAVWNYSEENMLSNGSSKQMAELNADDWRDLSRFFKAYLENAKAYWRPNSRSKFVETFPDVWASCTRWTSKNKPSISQPRPPEPIEPPAIDVSEYTEELAEYKASNGIDTPDQAIADDPDQWQAFMSYFFKQSMKI